MTIEEARTLMIDCFKVLYSKFKLSNNRVSIAYLTQQGFQTETVDFDIKFDYKGYLQLEDLIK